MANTNVIDLQAVATGPRVPTMRRFVPSHPLLRDGVLCLYDPTWLDRPDTRAALVNGDRMYNHAWVRAQKMIPAASQLELDGYWNVNATAAQIQTRRATLPNGKPGSYVGYTRQGAPAQSAQIGIINTPVWNYMAANLAHSFFVGGVISKYITDPGTLTGSMNQSYAMFGVVGAGADLADIRPHTTGSLINAFTSTNRLASRTMARTTGAAGVVNGAWSALAAAPSGTAYIQRWSFNGTNSSGDGLNHFPSYGWNCFMIEDLTVSGRNYSDVDTLMTAWHTAQNLTVGGRYEGETFPLYASIGW